MRPQKADPRTLLPGLWTPGLMSSVLCTPNHHGGVSSHPGNCGRCLEAQMEQPRVGSGASLSAGRRVAWGCPLPGGRAVGLQVPVPIVLGSARRALGCRQVGYVLAQPGLSPKPVPVGHCRGGSARHPPPHAHAGCLPMPMPLQASPNSLPRMGWSFQSTLRHCVLGSRYLLGRMGSYQAVSRRRCV